MKKKMKHADKAQDLKLIRSEIKKEEKKEMKKKGKKK